MEAPRLLFWLLLLGCPGSPTASVQCIFRNMTRNLIPVIYEDIKENLFFPFNLVEYLPDDFHPSPDFYGIAWKPVAYLGIATFAIFISYYVLAVKHRIHEANVQQMIVIIKNCMEENTKILENLSHWEKMISESKEWIKDMKKSNDSLSDEVNQLKVNIKTLEEKNETLTDILEQTQSSLENERLQNANRQDLVNMAARGPPPFPGPPFMHYPMGCPPPPLLRCWPPPPPWGLSDLPYHFTLHHLDNYIDT